MASDIKVRIAAITDGFDQAISKVETSLKNLSKTGEGTAATAQRWGERFTRAGQALMPASVAAGVLTGATIKLGSTYQAQMGKVQAISGATGTEMQKLKTLAMDATQGTKFSAIEAGQAMEYMGMAGWKTSDMINGLTPVLNLATASGEDLATTSDIVTDALTAFGLKAQDAAMFTDVLARASTNSNTTVKGMGETFKYCAPIAGALGYSVQDTALAIGLMANAGIKGSQAGTALRTAMTSLSAPTARAKNAMQQLGITTTDAQGKMLPFRDVIDQLRDKFKGLSKEQQIQAAKTIFGQEAMSGMLAIINASDEDYEKLANSIDNSTGAAQRMADTMSNADPIKKATAQIKNAFISVSEAIMPFVGIVAERIGKIAEGFQKLPKPVQAVIFAFTALTAAAAPVLLFVGNLLTTFAMASAAATALGTTVGAMALVFLKVVAVIRAVVRAAYILYASWDTIKEKATRLGSAISSAWESIKEKTSQVWTSITEALSTAWSGIVATAQSIWSGIVAFFAPIWQPIVAVWTTIWSAITEVLTTLWTAISTVAMTVFNAAKEVLTTIWDAITEVWTTVWTAISTVLTTIWTYICTLASTIFAPVISILSIIWNTLAEIWTTVWTGISALLSVIWTGICTLASTIFTTISTVISSVWNTIKSITSSVWNGIKSTVTSIWNGMKSTVSSVWNGMKAIIQTVWNTIKSITQSVWNAIKAILTGNFSSIKSLVTSTWNNIKTTITNAWNNIKSITQSTLNSIKSTVTSVLNAIKSTFVNMMNQIKTAVTNGMNNVKNAFRNGLNQAKSIITGMVGSFVSAGKSLIQGVARGVTSGASAVVSAVKSAVQSALNAAKSALGINSPSKVMAREVGRWIPRGVRVGIDTNLDSIKSMGKKMAGLVLNPSTGVEDVDYSGAMAYQGRYSKGMEGTDNRTINQTNNFYQKTESPSQIARKVKKVSKELLYE